MIAPGRDWVPAFETEAGKLPVLITDRSLTQCPTGYVTQESMAWIDEYYRVKSASKATRSPYFASLASADPRTVSTFDLLERENSYIDSELSKPRR